MNYCEYVDGANNNLGVDTITRVPTLPAALTATDTALDMGVGGTLDCGSTQPAPPPTGGRAEDLGSLERRATEYYDVWATMLFGGVLPRKTTAEVAEEHGMLGRSPSGHPVRTRVPV